MNTFIACSNSIFSIGHDDITSLVIIAYNDHISVISIDGTEFDLEEIMLY